MSKPVDLIVANALHDLAQRHEEFPPLVRALIDKHADRRNEAAARDLLVQIACGAGIGPVCAALAAVGAPSSAEEIGQRFDAVREQRATAASSSPSPAAHVPAPLEPAASDVEPPDARVAGYVIPFPKAEG